MAVVAVGLAPHPPIMVEAVGGPESGRVQASQEALRELGRRLAALDPDTLVMITPHGPVFRHAVSIWAVEHLKGDLAAFGAPRISLHRPVDLELAREIQEEATRDQIPTVWLDKPTAGRHNLEVALDHGVLVPLHFLDGVGVRCPMVVITPAFLPAADLYRFGQSIRRASNALGHRVAVVASGDLSHRLTPAAPAGFSPRGAEFDRLVTGALAAGDVDSILGIGPDLAEAAGECGWRPLLMALGSLQGQELRSHMLAYEGPFGVGYAVAHVEPARAESLLVALARRSLETYIRTGEIVDPPDPLPPEVRTRSGAFVSLKINGQLRGCIGTIAPTKADLASEIIHNAIAAGTEDPRFLPVREDELDSLTYSVDVLGEPEPVRGPEELDPRRYGVIVSDGRRSGLLLPDLPGIDDPATQVRIAAEKAGIPAGSPGITLRRFTVTRHH